MGSTIPTVAVNTRLLELFETGHPNFFKFHLMVKLFGYIRPDSFIPRPLS